MVQTALNAGIVNTNETRKVFGIDIDRARRGISTGVSPQNRATFLTITTMRAYDKAHGLI